ncbi:hypothetical protein [Haloferax sp. Q22]|uniref:hypothetical protein n=1 Tax=Haloferax sp. (strain Q22) TaxID=1526048 RepID=UPI000737D7B1|nr:hypothetical protein [Haloferax sp. Q22]
MESGEDSESQEGPNAVLTSKQRKYLSGEEEFKMSDQARWQMYSRIRDRLRWAIYDFALLGGRHSDNWEELNLDKLFTEENMDHHRTRDGARGMFYVLYRGLFNDYMPPFDRYLEHGVTLAERHMNNRHVRVTFNVERPAHGNVIVDSALARVTPDDVDGLRIPEMQAVLQTLAESDVDVAELIWEEENREPLFGRDRGSYEPDDD